MIEAVTALGTSDVCAGWPGAGPYAATQVAHLGIGGLAALAPMVLRAALAGGWITKEVAADLAGCDWSPLVAMDSALDLAVAVAGFALVRVMRFRHVATDKARAD